MVAVEVIQVFEIVLDFERGSCHDCCSTGKDCSIPLVLEGQAFFSSSILKLVTLKYKYCSASTAREPRLGSHIEGLAGQGRARRRAS